MAKASVRHSAETAMHDLGHLVGPHPLLSHPVQGLRLGPVAPQSDLEVKRSARNAPDSMSWRIG